MTTDGCMSKETTYSLFQKKRTKWSKFHDFVMPISSFEKTDYKSLTLIITAECSSIKIEFSFNLVTNYARPLATTTTTTTTTATTIATTTATTTATTNTTTTTTAAAAAATSTTITRKKHEKQEKREHRSNVFNRYCINMLYTLLGMKLRPRTLAKNS